MGGQPFRELHFKDWIIVIDKIEDVESRPEKNTISGKVSYKNVRAAFCFEMKAGSSMIDEFKRRLVNKMLYVKDMYEAQENLKKFRKDLSEMEINESDLVYEKI